MKTILSLMQEYTTTIEISFVLFVLYYYILFKNTSEDKKRIYIYDNAKPKVIDEDMLFMFFTGVLILSNLIIFIEGSYKESGLVALYDSVITLKTLMIITISIISNIGLSAFIFSSFLRKDSKLIRELIKKYKIEKIVVLDHFIMATLISLMAYFIIITLKVLFV